MHLIKIELMLDQLLLINSGIQTSVFNTAQESGSDFNDHETIFLNFPSNTDAKSKDLFYNI